MTIRNVIFDLDGTLLDTSEGIIESIQFAVHELGYEQLSYDELCTFVGPPIQQSFMNHYGCDKETAQKAADIFREYYMTTALLKAKPYDGIYELCERLKKKDIRMAVATYKREDYAVQLLCHFHFNEYCDPMHGGDNLDQLRKEDIIKRCQSEMNASPENSVMVGDTVGDALGAVKANTPFIAVTYGFGFKIPEEINAYPNIGTAGNPLEIADLIL